jgi:N,N'-diacetyllegionaminate synthase
VININNRILKNYGKPFLIAEAGINHNGDINQALKMVEVAKASGVDAIKFQTFRADEFCRDKEQTFTYKSQGKEVTELMFEMFKRHEFRVEEWYQIKQKCDSENIFFLSTPQNRSDLDLLLKLEISAIKVGSDDFTNLPLLEDYATTKLPMIVSCGMSDMAEVFQALEAIGTFEGYPTILLLCTSEYPTPPENVNLLKLETLKNSFPELVVGFSDHTQGTMASSLAVGFGAVMFEKHFTLDNDLEGPDHWFSENPTGLVNWTAAIHNSFKMMGSRVIRPSKGEAENKKEFQRVVVAKKYIQLGDVFDMDNLTVSRVSGGKGFPPSFLNTILGLKSNKIYSKNAAITI